MSLQDKDITSFLQYLGPPHALQKKAEFKNINLLMSTARPPLNRFVRYCAHCFLEPHFFLLFRHKNGGTVLLSK
jgi:hypothetical protein